MRRGQKFTPEQSARLSAAMMGKRHTTETRAKMRGNKNALGHTVSAESKIAMGLPHIGNKYSVGRVIGDGTRQKLRDFNLGKKHGATARAKISAALLGRPVSAATRAKMSQTQIGKKLAENHKQNMAAAFRRRPSKCEALMATVLDRCGIAYKPQAVLAGCIVDFFLEKHNIALEVDLCITERRRKNTAILEAAGYKVMCIKNRTVKLYPERVAASVLDRIRE